jgi:uncharacterized protein (DUF433 family)
MTNHTDIGSLIVRSDDIRRGRPRIAGTGVTVRRIVVWYKQGFAPFPSRIARNIVPRT